MRCGDATQHDVKQLRRENEELKQLVGDLSLEVYRLKTTAIPMPRTPPIPTDVRCREGDDPSQSSLVSSCPQAQDPQRSGHRQEHPPPVAQAKGPTTT